MAYKMKGEVHVIEAMRDFSNKQEESWMVGRFQEYSRGCYVDLYRDSIEEQFIIDRISNLIGTDDWERVLVEWDW